MFCVLPCASQQTLPLPKGPNSGLSQSPQMPVWAGSAPLCRGAGQEESGFPSGLDFAAARNSRNSSLHNSLAPHVKTFRKTQPRSFHKVQSPTPVIKHFSPGMMLVAFNQQHRCASMALGRVRDPALPKFRACPSALILLGGEMLFCSLWCF